MPETNAISEGMPTPKTYKEWAIAKLCGLNFEMPKKDQEELIVMDGPFAWIHEESNLYSLAFADIRPLKYVVFDSPDNVMINGQSVRVVAGEDEEVDGEIVLVFNDEDSKYTVMVAAPTEEMLLPGYIYDVQDAVITKKTVFEPKTPTEQYFAYAIANREAPPHVIG